MPAIVKRLRHHLYAYKLIVMSILSCNEKKLFLENLLLVNRQAGVDSEVVDLIESYARLRLARNRKVDFYEARPSAVIKKDPMLQDFLQKNSQLDQRALNFLTAYYLEMKNAGLTCLFNCAHLSHVLNVPLKKLRFMARDSCSYYKFAIPKANGTNRIIMAPKPDLKVVQRKINHLILQKVHLNNRAEGFRKKHSIVTNSLHHLKKKVVVKMDIRGFFPSIHFERVFGVFRSLGYPRGVALLLTDLSTCQRVLPTGAPTSPAISNIICRKLDKRLVRLCEKSGFEYSRYADDITVSGNSEQVVKMIPLYRRIIVDEGFEVNEEKLRITRSGRRQKVTGIVVNRKMNIDRREIRKLRAVLNNCRHGSIAEQADIWASSEKKCTAPFTYPVEKFKKSLHARISFVKMVNPQMGGRLLDEFHSVFSAG